LVTGDKYFKGIIMKYLFTLLLSVSFLTPALANTTPNTPAEKPKTEMLLAKKKSEKDKEAKEAKEKAAKPKAATEPKK
jgi:hypothetical protein